MKYLSFLLSCFMLMIPIMAWNILMANELPAKFQPEIFQNSIPPFIIYCENVSRIVLFLLTALMPLSFSSKKQKLGLLIYIAGAAVYCSSWLALIMVPNSIWSNSMWGFMAPAYTPAIWLVGILLIGNRFYFELRHARWYFFSVAVSFLFFHNLHTWIVYSRG